MASTLSWCSRHRRKNRQRHVTVIYLFERNLNGHTNLDISRITTNNVTDHARTFLKFDNSNRHWTLV